MQKVKVNESEAFREKAAKALLREVVYEEMDGNHFVDITDWKIYFRENDTPNPWGESAIVIPLTSLAPGVRGVEDVRLGVQKAVLVGLSRVSFEDFLIAYIAAHWLHGGKDNLIELSRVAENFDLLYEECWDECLRLTVWFVMKQMLDEVDLD